MSARARHRPWFRDRRELTDLRGLVGVPIVEHRPSGVNLARVWIARHDDYVTLFPHEITYVEACRQEPDPPTRVITVDGYHTTERFYRPLRWLA